MKKVYFFSLIVFLPLASVFAAPQKMQKYTFNSYDSFKTFFEKKIDNAQHEIQIVSESCSDKRWLKRLKKAKRRGLNVAALRNTPCDYLERNEVEIFGKPPIKVFAAPLIMQIDGELFYASFDIGQPKSKKKLLAVKAPTRLWEAYKEQFALAAGAAAVAPPVYRSGVYQSGKPALGKKMQIPANQESIMRSKTEGSYNYDKGKPLRSAPQGVSRSLPKQPIYKKLGRGH